MYICSSMYIYIFVRIHKSTRPSSARQQLCQPFPPRVRADIGEGGAEPETSAALPAPGAGGWSVILPRQRKPKYIQGMVRYSLAG